MGSTDNDDKKTVSRVGQRISVFYNYEFVKHGKSYFLKRNDGKHKRIILNIGPHWPGVIVTLALICGGTRVNSHIAYGAAHGDRTKLLIMQIIIAFFCISTIVTLLLTAVADCGVLLSSPVSPDDEAALDGTYCDICDIFQPSNLRIHHCSFCDVCIAGHGKSHVFTDIRAQFLMHVL